MMKKKLTNSLLQFRCCNITRFLDGKRFYGELQNIEDFVVKEILSEKFQRKFIRTKGRVKRMCGRYALYLLKKKNLSTKSCINLLSEILGIDTSLIRFAGLKDKKAITYQYITIKDAKELYIKKKNVELSFIKYVNAPMNIGELKANKFRITLHNCKHLEYLKIIDILNNTGMPNFFGPQRFGKKGKNWKRGKKIIVSRQYTSKEHAKFLIQSYQSLLFNATLRMYIKQYKKPLFKQVPLPGFKTKLDNSRFSKLLKEVLNEEHVQLSDFRINGLTCMGSMRNAFIKPLIKYEIKEDTVVLTFSLPPGAYATVLLYEVCDFLDLR